MASWKPAQSFFQKQNQGNLILLNPHDIVRIPECQPRVDGIDEKLVAEYAQDMRDYDAFYADHDPPVQGWQKFPSVLCVHDPKIGYILFSGNHRLEAMLQVGYTEVEIHFFTGTRQDAIVISKRENADNGKRRTNADKAHVVKSCLLDPELKLWSNPTIAKWCGVSTNTVKNHEEALSNLLSEKGELYTRPTRRKRLSKHGEIEWVETASIGNGSGKPNRKELKRKHHSAVVNVQSAFFAADLHDHESFSHIEHVETGLKAQEFFRRIVFVKRLELRPSIFATNFDQDFSHEAGKVLTNAEIEAEIEVLEKIASQIRWYGQSEEHHLGWIERVLEMEPEPQETAGKVVEPTEPEPQETEPEAEPDNLEASWKNEWLPRLKEVFIEKGYDPETIHPRIYKAVHGDQKTQIYDMSDAQLTALISQSKTVFNWKDNPENWITNRGESKIGWALRLLEDVTDTQETEPVEQTEKDSPSLSEKTEALKAEVKAYLPTWKGNNPDTTYATLFHLLDARFRIKHGIPRSRSPFFFEELDGLLPLMKVNDLELADKVREILATDPSGVKSTAVESEADDESSPSLNDRMDRLRSDLLNNHWLHQYSWEGLDILPFVQEYDIGAGMIDVIQKEIAAEYPKPDTPDEASQNGSNYRLEFLSIGLRDADDNPVKPLSFQLIASREMGEHPLSEVPDALRAELLKLVERVKA